MKNLLLDNKSAIVTGSSQGLGKEIAKGLLIQGANVLICGRNKKILKKTFNDLKYHLSKNQSLIMMECDVSKETDVKKLIKFAKEQFLKIEILVNNAGVYGPKGLFEENNTKDWKNSFEINFYGSIFTIKHLIKHFKKNNYGKVIQLSGGGATSPLPNLSSYAASKAAIVRFIETISLEVKNYNIDLNSIAPGALNTKMLDEVIEAGPKKIGNEFYNKMINIKNNGGTDFRFAVELSVYLSSSLSDGVSGKLISAVWDNWESFHKYKQILEETDVFTLRRIVGRDRKMFWADK